MGKRKQVTIPPHLQEQMLCSKSVSEVLRRYEELYQYLREEIRIDPLLLDYINEVRQQFRHVTLRQLRYYILFKYRRSVPIDTLFVHLEYSERPRGEKNER